MISISLLKNLDKKIDSLLMNATHKDIQMCIDNIKGDFSECNNKCKNIIKSITNERQQTDR